MSAHAEPGSSGIDLEHQRQAKGTLGPTAEAIFGVRPGEPTVSVSNETRARLIIQDEDLVLDLAPLERRSLRLDVAKKLPLERLELLGYVKADDDDESMRDGRRERAVFLAGSFYGGLVFLIWAIFFGTSWFFWTLLGLVVTIAAVRRLSRENVGVRVVQAVYLVVVLVVGIAMPVIAVWTGGNIDHVWDTAVNGTGQAQEEATLVLLGRGIQTVFLVVVTLLPGLLYFLFDRYRLSTLSDEFMRQSFRLDPSLQTRGDIYAKYGHLMDEAYGRHLGRSAGSGRLQPGTRLPIIVATVTFALGWIVVLLNAEVDVDVLKTGVRSLIAPWPSATAFAFLGAYVFILQAAIRAFFRGDLRPKFYGYAALRIIVAVVFSWVLDMMLPTDEDAPLLLVTAFAVGLVPDTFILRLREFLRDKKLIDQLTEKHPLTVLEGPDIYDRTRLEQEGVTNVEALAHSNLIELILQTRIPPGRLVDWTDQAHLYLHLHSEAAEKPSLDQMKVLRQHAIRTASDLLVAYKAATERENGDVAALTAMLGSSNGGPPLLQTIVDAISDEEWMAQILAWHDADNRGERTLRFPADFATNPSPLHL